ncbi:MAG: hypothetical protein FWC10_02700 [Lentimicrobiaceae bacterium]|nr:hypothetical protein [Lentimicrobiaceae bacterium]
MKKLYTILILFSIGITQIYAQCYQCNGTNFLTGTFTNATGQNSFVGGNYSVATNNYGFVFGDHSTVSGLNGIVLGNYANVSQSDGIAIGSYVKSNAANSYVFGQYLNATGSNSLTLGIGTSSGSPLVNSKNNSIMFGVTNKPSLTIVKPTNGDVGYLGIGTDEPQEMAHVVGNLLIERTDLTASSLQFKHPNTKGIDPGQGGGSTPSTKPYYWDIFSDSDGLKFNTVANTAGTQRMIISRTGSVGIGTEQPLHKLHIQGGNLLLTKTSENPSGALFFGDNTETPAELWEVSYNSTSSGIKGLNFSKNTNSIIIIRDDERLSNSVLFLSDDDKVAIGHLNPQAKLDVSGSFKAKSANVVGTLTANSATITDALTANNATITGALSANSATITDALTANSATITGALSANSATITGALSANILKASSAEIKGKIKTQEVEVTLSGWPDFVFEDNYPLMSLPETEQFIKANKHLPNVPSAAAVEANGVNLGEMNAILIQKVEELTLYILDLQKQINELKTK